MKYKVAKSPYKTIGENKNKTNWNTYGVIHERVLSMLILWNKKAILRRRHSPMGVWNLQIWNHSHISQGKIT